MRKCLGKIFGILAAVLLAGCRGVPDVLEQKGSVVLPDQFCAQTDIRYGDLALEGEYRRLTTGESSLCLQSPESMQGLTLTLSGDGLTMSYEGMTFAVDSGTQAENAVMRILSASLDSLSGRSFTIAQKDASYRLSTQNEYGPLEAVVVPGDGEHFLPEQISAGSLHFSAVFHPSGTV